MKKILVLGIGSAFGLDHLGWAVINRLETKMCSHQALYDNVSFLTVARTDPGLLELMLGYEDCLIVDAMLFDHNEAADDETRVREINIDDIEALPGCFSSHGFGLKETLQLGKRIGMLPASVDIIGLGAADGDAVDSRRQEAIIQTAATMIMEKLEPVGLNTVWLQIPG